MGENDERKRKWYDEIAVTATAAQSGGGRMVSDEVEWDKPLTAMDGEHKNDDMSHHTTRRDVIIDRRGVGPIIHADRRDRFGFDPHKQFPERLKKSGPVNDAAPRPRLVFHSNAELDLEREIPTQGTSGAPGFKWSPKGLHDASDKPCRVSTYVPVSTGAANSVTVALETESTAGTDSQRIAAKTQLQVRVR